MVDVGHDRDVTKIHADDCRSEVRGS
jgi:hypothetical protein